MRRRDLLTAATLGFALAPSRASGDGAFERGLRAGGCVAVFRHARAPGVFDPPGMRLDDCATQRNLDDTGREQARRLGAWFAARGLQPARVRSSPWCRCLDTARLAFGRADAWAALGSPRAADEATNAAALRELRAALAAAARAPGFEVWVTHMFVIDRLVDGSAASAEGLLLQVTEDGGARVAARLAPT